MNNKKGLSSETVGNIVSAADFEDLYSKVWNEGERYFARKDETGAISVVIVFQDVDDFSESSGAQIMLDFQRYKDRLIMVVWTLLDPKNPLGFPISFSVTEEGDLLQITRLVEQERIWVHYLASEGDDLIHIYSDAFEIPEDEKRKIPQLLKETGAVQQDDSAFPEIAAEEADRLSDDELNQAGIGYSFDFTAMLRKMGESEAQEKMMSGLLQAIHMVKRHPRSSVRESSFLVWAAEKRETTVHGEDSRMISILLTPPLRELFDIVHDQQEDENPFSTVLLAFPEFLVSFEANPLSLGAFPIFKYDAGRIIHLDIHEGFAGRLAYLFGDRPDNPYSIK